MGGERERERESGRESESVMCNYSIINQSRVTRDSIKNKEIIE